MKKSLLLFALFTFSLTRILSQSITITSPNGAEQWTPASSQSITWNSAGGITDVNIYYSTNNGTSFSLVTPFLPNSGTYSWTIPAVNSTQCKVRIVDANNTNIADTSDSVFTIAVPASLTLTHPNGGETLTSGTSDTITWTSTGTIDYLELYYSTDFGSTWIFVNDGIQNTGSYIWTVPEVNSSECMVKIMEIGGSNARDSSNTIFTIQMPPPSNYALDFDGVNDYVNIPHNSVFNFNGGDFTFEFWNYQSTVTNGEIISKRTYSTADGILIGVYNGNYVIWLSSGAGWNVFNGYAFATATGGTWNHIAVVRDGGNYKFYKNGVLQNTMAGAGLTNNSQPLSFGRDLAGVGAYSGKLDEVRIWNIARNASEIQSYMNSCVNTPQAGLVAGYDFEDGTGSLILSDNSGNVNKGSLNNMDFANDWVASGYSCVAPSASLTITYPDGDETLISGASDTITWTSTGTINFLELYYSTDSGSSWIFVNDGIQNYGYYIWTVPAVNSSECLVKIMETGGSNASDSSNSVFSISSPSAALTITYPNGGELLTVGTTVNITWATSGTVSTVDLYYSTDEGIFWNFINESLPNTGSYSWTIPNDTSSTCRIKIMDSTNPLTVFDSSDTSFTIQTAVSQIISTIAGTGTAGYNGDGSIGTSAQLNGPIGIGIDASSNIYVAEFSSNRIRKINAATGIITTVAGTGTSGYSGDGGISTSAQIGFPMAVHADASGNIYIADMNNSRIRKINGATGIINTIAGNGTAGYSGDGGPATSAKIWGPNGMCTDAAGNVYFVDGANARIRVITTTGLIATVAGTGTAGYSGDGGAATSAQVNPTGISIDASGNLYIADRDNHRIRKINSSNGIITTIAGNGSPGFTGDGGLASAAKLNAPGAVYFDASGNLYIADKDNQLIRKIDASGIINTVAGNGNQGYAGDGGPATSAELNVPTGVCADASGNFYIADYVNHRIRKVGAGSPPSSSITITYPNGGETLTAGTTDTITWTSSGTINYLEFYYSIDGGSTWNFIDDGIQNTGSYVWSVPAGSSANCLVLINEIGGSGATDTSNAVFTISAPIDNYALQFNTSGKYVSVTDAPAFNIDNDFTIEAWVKTPGFGQQGIITQGLNSGTGYAFFAVGGTLYFQYYSGGSYNNGATSLGIAAGLNDNNWHHIAVVVNGANGKLYVDGVVLQQITSMNPVDESASNIHFGYHPNVGQFPGQMDEARLWSVARTPAEIQNNMNVCFSGPQNGLVAAYNFNDGPNNSVLTDYSGNGNNGTLTNMNIVADWVSSGVTCSQLSGSLTITSPNGGENWNIGTSYNITWNTTGTVNTVDLYYSTDGGNTWNFINDFVTNTGSYNWTIPNAPSTNCMIKIEDTNNPSSVFDISNNNFSIVSPFVTVSVPNEGEIWNCNTYNYIYWANAGLSNYVNLEYSTDSGATWASIAYGTYNYGYYNWYVPAIPSVNCLIRVTDYYTSSLTDISDNPFTINCSNQSITVTDPNGGEQWGIGNGNYIYWTSTNVGNVKIEYSINSGSTWTTVASSIPAGNGSYWWTVPNTPSSQCLVKISDVLDSSITDMSNAVFSIINPSITVTQPEGGEQWTAGYSQLISWISTGISGYITISYSINNGNSWIPVANGINNNNYYYWTVPNNPSANCRIKVSDYYNSSLSDVNDTTFTILAAPPALALAGPDGGEVFSIGTTEYIYWTSTSINYIKLEYTYNGGTTWNVIQSGIAAGTGYYAWPVPNTPTSAALVRISDASNTSLNDQSNGYFSIVSPEITVTTPNGNESWTGLTSQYIYWNTTAVSNYVTIEYSINNGSSWSIIANGTYNYGYYNWSVPNNPSVNCLVRVKDYYNNTISDISDSTFTILAAPASIVVSSPNGGEAWGVGTTKNITWSSSAVNNVKIEYSVNGGTSWNVIIGNTPAANGYFSWPVPNNPSGNCFVKITSVSDTTISDQSNNDFTIISPSITVTSPNGAESWTAGTGNYISWTSSGISSYVKIEYSTDSGSTWFNIASSAYNNGSYWWTVPNTPSSKCFVRVSDYYNNAVNDAGNSVFSIVSPLPSITLTSPNGGETLIVGNTYYINWNSTGVSNVKLEYSANGGTSWNTIIASAVNNGSYNWPVPNNPSTVCLIKVSDAGSPGTNDVSNNYFSISAPYITLTQPNGGEVFQGSNGYYISWTSAGVSYVKIEYSINNGSSWSTLVSSSYNNGYYYWTVPNDSSTNCLVKVSSTANPSIVNDQSNNVFTITPPVPSLTLNSPNSGEYWYVGYQYYITWSSSAVSNVKLEYSVNGGTTWAVIIASTSANSGFYYWPVPNNPSVNCKVRVSDASASAVNDVSYGIFTIATPVPSITVNYPNGGETWLEGSYQYVSWTKNFVNTANVQYSIDSGATWNMLVSNTSSTYYYWTIPGTASTNCLIKVVSASDTSVTDKSDAVFTINLYVPNTNTITTDSIAPLPFCKEDTFSVFYTANGVFNAGNVFTAQLSDSNGNFNYPLGIGSLADTISGTIACVVPSSVLNANGYRIRVVSSDLSTTGTNNGTDIIISSPEFDFAASETIKYLPDGSVQFSFIGDTSGVMSYAWSFGNGDSSAVADPNYVYSTIGYYTVDLTVTDDNACDINLSKYNYMRIEQLLPNTQLTTNTTVDLTDVYFSDIATGIMTMADGNCLITLDSGSTWTVSYTGLNGYAASVSMQPGYWVVTGANGSIVYSVDNGLSWLPQYTGTLETFFGSSFSAPDFGFSVGTNGVVFNYNGISWTSQTSGISATLNSVYTLGNNAYSVGNNGSILYYNGSTWATQTTPVSANLNSVFFTGLSSGLAVGDNGYILNYDGTDWNVALSGVDVNFSSVTATGDSAWAVSNKGIIYWSDDAGLTWMRYSVGSNTDLSGISYVKSGGKAASSSKGYIGGKGGEGRMIGSEVAEDTTTAVSQTVKAKNNFLIYPNPALDMIYLEAILDKAETMVVQLRDINGNLVKTVTDANITGFYSEHINVSSLASGVYFVHVLQGDKFWVRKVVVQ